MSNPILMERWLSGLKHSPAKGEDLERGSEGSNPSLSAKIKEVYYGKKRQINEVLCRQSFGLG